MSCYVTDAPAEGSLSRSGISLCSHLEITQVVSRTKSGFVYVNATSDPGTTFGPDQLICERYNLLDPPLWRCGLY